MRALRCSPVSGSMVLTAGFDSVDEDLVSDLAGSLSGFSNFDNLLKAFA